MSIEKKELDMTRGEPGKLLLMFMMPLLGTYILQQMYTLADTIIVGRGVGLTALAAVGATDMPRSIVMWGVTGLTDGFWLRYMQFPRSISFRRKR